MRARGKPTKTDLASEYLVEYVSAQGGSMPAAELTEHMRGLGFGKNAVEQAKRENGRSETPNYQSHWVYVLYANDNLYEPEKRKIAMANQGVS